MAERHKIEFKRRRIALGGGNDGLFWTPGGVVYPLMNSESIDFNSVEYQFNTKV